MIKLILIVLFFICIWKCLVGFLNSKTTIKNWELKDICENIVSANGEDQTIRLSRFGKYDLLALKIYAYGQYKPNYKEDYLEIKRQIERSKSLKK